MSQYIALASMSGDGMTVCEHSVTRVVAGDAERVRGRLSAALESLGYTVVSDHPLQARRAKQKDIVRADFTDHARKLAVGLRQVGESATQVNFEFAVTHGGCMTKGDLKTLELEAEAVVALASAPPATGLCLSCGTENGGEARFCRLCGAPNTTAAPAELEVLRLTAGARAGLQEVVGGLFIALLIAACMVPLILFGKAKGSTAGWALLAVGEFIGWWMALYGILRLHRTLNRRPAGHALPAAAAAPQLARAQASSLPPARFSVTEGTTELLGSAPRVREKVPAREKRGDNGRAG